VVYLGEDSRGQQPLVSEAVRGEGAVLVDDAGARFMACVHELADLAPRDVVAKAIMARMLATGRPNMWLDARSFGAAKWQQRFPTIYATLLSHGIDPAVALIPVVPAAHYVSGGIATDLDGRSSLPGLFSCGEAACSGVHGANRLASNSLLEGLVFGRRIAEVLIGNDLGPAPRTEALDGVSAASGLVSADARRPLQELMSRHAGVLRDAAGLEAAARGIDELAAKPSESTGDTAAWETTNLLTIGAGLVAAATRRHETRGSHWRADYPERDDDHWRRHLDVSLVHGELAIGEQDGL
jgi:L-aspartate oxidase